MKARQAVGFGFMGRGVVVRRVAATVVFAGLLMAAATWTAAADRAGRTCTPPDRPVVILETSEGAIEIELVPAAAPEAVEMLVRLVEGPVFRDELIACGPQRGPVGYYDGLSFDHAHPGTELTTAARPPANSILVKTQIDGAALGLDEVRLGSSAEAMDVWQNEILPYDGSVTDRERLHPRLREWLRQWRETMRPDFLLEATQLDINEALGYRYESGLPSLPVRRGSVALKPVGREWSAPRMIIELVDRPELDGRLMVVGRVIAGLDLADSISRRRLTPDKSASNRPLIPVRILDGKLECRPASSDAEMPREEEQ